ncbi:hypothetical protein Ddc_07030 [Ditylenchus destructor]|nr:hypothetical protein Ddc_07030 [Ditylenchus destructor]
MGRLSLSIFMGIWLVASVIGFHIEGSIPRYGIYLDTKLSGEITLDLLSHHKVKFTADSESYRTLVRVFEDNDTSENVLKQLSSEHERQYTTISQDDNGFVVRPGDFGFKMDFWPTLTLLPSSPPLHLNDSPVRWTLLLVFSKSNDVVALSSYAMKAYVESHEYGNQTLIAASYSQDSEWYWLSKCTCKQTTSTLQPSQLLTMNFEDLCLTVHMNDAGCHSPDSLDESGSQNHRPRHYSDILPYFVFYIIKLLLIVLVIGIIVALIARLRRQHKERMRVLPRVSYVYSSNNPAQARAEIIPTTVASEQKDVSELVFH